MAEEKRKKMKNKEYVFSVEENTSKEIAAALSESLHTFNKHKRKYKKTGEPVIVCVGTDLAIFDTLGPLCGTLLKEKMPDISLYGSLGALQTALNIRQTSAWLKRECLNRPIIAIDAAVTDEESIGTIKIGNEPLHPGSGAGKKLGQIGEISVLGLTSLKNAWGGSSIRLGLVYSMAETISNGIVLFLNEWKRNNKQIKENNNEKT